MQDPLQSKKKLLAILAIALVFILSLGIYRYLSAARITISSSDKANSVSITPLQGEKADTKNAKTASHTLRSHLKPGTYQISVFNHNNAVSKVVVLKGWHHYSYKLDIKKPSPVGPVLAQEVSSVVATNSSLIFIDDVSKRLMEVTGDNSLISLNTALTFKQVKATSPSIVIAQDTANNLYNLVDGVLNPISLPFTITSDDSVDYDISGGGILYVSHNGEIYSGNIAGGFTHIYSSMGREVKLSGSDEQLALLSTGGGEEGQQSDSGTSKLVVINDNGKKVAEKNNLKLYKAVWSPDGKHLLAKGNYGSLLLDDSLENAVSVPSQNIGDNAWINNSSIVFTNKDVVWEYDIATKSMYQVSDIASGTILSLYPSQDGKAVYFSSERSDINGNASGTVLARTWLSGHTSDSELNTLSIFLPDTADVCTVSYLNFSRLSLLLYYPPGSTSDSCVTPAEDLLDYYGISRDKYAVQPLPLNITD
jgi:hypothetical protein